MDHSCVLVVFENNSHIPREWEMLYKRIQFVHYLGKSRWALLNVLFEPWSVEFSSEYINIRRFRSFR